MMRLAARLSSIAIALGLLQACQPKADAPAAVAAAPEASASAATLVPTGAADDASASLMAEALPGWTAKAPHPIQVSSREAGNRKDITVLVSPGPVAALDADHRLLVVSGPPEDRDGRPMDGHIVEANVSLYGFERRNGRWFKASEQASIAWTGFNGSAGTLKIHAIGAGRTALSIENGSCWQGTCGEWLQIHQLDMHKSKPLATLMSGSTSTGATAGCEEWLKGKPLAADEAMPITAENCFDVGSQWRFDKPGETGWPDLMVKFMGAEAAPGGKAGQLAPRPIDEQLVLRHDGSAYKLVRGRNPTHEF